MAEVEYIKHLYENEGKSLREISKIVKKDFRTVQKYAYCNDWRPSVGASVNPTDYPVLGAFIPVIDEWLKQDRQEPRKQRHSRIRIFKRLQKENGFTGSYSSVKRYVARKKDVMKREEEGFLPLEHPPGHAQVDFGDFKYYDAAGVSREGHALIVAFPNSNVGWMQVFPSENQECLLEGLKRIFYHVGGVPQRLRCDNMPTAVSQVLKGTERVITDGFYRFMLHHRFSAEFCRPGKGNEKGCVENKVGYTRRNMLVPVPTIENFEMYNAEIFRLCDEDHEREHYQKGGCINALWEEEKKSLLSLPEYEYEVFRYESLTINKWGFMIIDTVKYGLSPELYNKIVQAKIYFDKIEVYYDHCLLKTYRRSYEKNSESLDWKEYLPVLTKKPGAIPHTRFFNQMPKLWQEHLKSATNRERKSALAVLMEILKDGNESLCDEALELAEENGRTDADSIRQCYYFISKIENHPQPLTLTTATPVLNYIPNLSAYDGLIGGATFHEHND
jgi:transposase